MNISDFMATRDTDRNGNGLSVRALMLRFTENSFIPFYICFICSFLFLLAMPLPQSLLLSTLRAHWIRKLISLMRFGIPLQTNLFLFFRLRVFGTKEPSTKMAIRQHKIIRIVLMKLSRWKHKNYTIALHWTSSNDLVFMRQSIGNFTMKNEWQQR